jgi:hypothetical protein
LSKQKPRFVVEKQLGSVRRLNANDTEAGKRRRCLRRKLFYQSLTGVLVYPQISTAEIELAKFAMQVNQ